MNRIQRVSQSGINASAINNLLLYLVSFGWYFCPAGHLGGHFAGHIGGLLGGHIVWHLGGHLRICPLNHLLILRAASVTSLAIPFLRRNHVLECFCQVSMNLAAKGWLIKSIENQIMIVWKGKGMPTLSDETSWGILDGIGMNTWSNWYSPDAKNWQWISRIRKTSFNFLCFKNCCPPRLATQAE